jgi:PST family polysaccharide transporter
MLMPLAYGLSTLSGPIDPRTPIVVLIISAGLIFQAFDAIDLWFQAKVRSVYAVIAKSVAFLLLSATKVLLITYHAPLEAFAWTALAETMLAAIGLAIAYQISGNQVRRWRFRWRSAMALLRESSPEIFAALGAIMFMRMDQIMLGHMLGPDAVGLYSAAVMISEVWYFIPIAIVASTYPGIIKAKSQSEELYYQHLHRLFVGLALLSISIAIIVSLLSAWIVYALYGATYSGAATVLAIHSWTLMAVSFGLVSGSWIFTERKAILNLYRTALGAVANVILNLLLIPSFGLAGAAVATLASQLLAYYVFDMFTPSMKHIFTLKTRAAILVDARAVITSMLQR